MNWTEVVIGAVGAVALVAGGMLTYAATVRGKRIDHQNPVTVTQAYATLVEDLRKQNADQSERIERLEANQKALAIALERAKEAELACLASTHELRAEVAALTRQLRALGVPLRMFGDEEPTAQQH